MLLGLQGWHYLTTSQRMSRDRAGLGLHFPFQTLYSWLSIEPCVKYMLVQGSNPCFPCCLPGGKDWFSRMQLSIRLSLELVHCLSAVRVLLAFSLIIQCPVSQLGTPVLPAMTKMDTGTSLPILQHCFYFCRFFNPTRFTDLVNCAIPPVVFGQL